MKYWDVPDDGAPLRCVECNEQAPAKEMFFTETPDGSKAILHKVCVDEWWIENATYQGMFKLP
jgi:hypothetical protein